MFLAVTTRTQDPLLSSCLPRYPGVVGGLTFRFASLTLGSVFLGGLGVGLGS